MNLIAAASVGYGYNIEQKESAMEILKVENRI